METTSKPLRILDFDCEARPLSYLGQDFTTREITAIAWSWADEDAVQCAQIDRHGGALGMLTYFREMYDQADIVTGHYIRAYDLPNLNGAMAEFGLPELEQKLTIDTKSDLVGLSGISKSQESLAQMLGIESPKIHMTQPDWREANRLTPAGLAKTRERVVGDVKQHKELRLELTRRGLLKPPKLWSPR